MAEARGGQLDGALPRARHRARRLRRHARVLRARTRRDLQAGVVERRPRRADPEAGELLHEGAADGEDVDRRRPRHRRRGARVPQHLPPPRQQAGLAGLPARGDERHLPAVHLQVPRLALRPRRCTARSCSRRTSSSTSTRPTTASYPSTATCGRASSSSTSTTRRAGRCGSSSARWSPRSTATRSTG